MQLQNKIRKKFDGFRQRQKTWITVFLKLLKKITVIKWQCGNVTDLNRNHWRRNKLFRFGSVSPLLFLPITASCSRRPIYPRAFWIGGEISILLRNRADTSLVMVRLKKAIYDGNFQRTNNEKRTSGENSIIICITKLDWPWIVFLWKYS